MNVGTRTLVFEPPRLSSVSDNVDVSCVSDEFPAGTNSILFLLLRRLEPASDCLLTFSVGVLCSESLRLLLAVVPCCDDAVGVDVSNGPMLLALTLSRVPSCLVVVPGLTCAVDATSCVCVRLAFPSCASALCPRCCDDCCPATLVIEVPLTSLDGGVGAGGTNKCTSLGLATLL